MNKIFRNILSCIVVIIASASSAQAYVGQTGTIAEMAPETVNGGTVSVWLSGIYPGTECSGGRWAMNTIDPQ